MRWPDVVRANAGCRRKANAGCRSWPVMTGEEEEDEDGAEAARRSDPVTTAAAEASTRATIMSRPDVVRTNAGCRREANARVVADHDG